MIKQNIILYILILTNIHNTLYGGFVSNNLTGLIDSNNLESIKKNFNQIKKKIKQENQAKIKKNQRRKRRLKRKEAMIYKIKDKLKIIKNFIKNLNNDLMFQIAKPILIKFICGLGCIIIILRYLFKKDNSQKQLINLLKEKNLQKISSNNPKIKETLSSEVKSKIQNNTNQMEEILKALEKFTEDDLKEKADIQSALEKAKEDNQWKFVKILISFIEDNKDINIDDNYCPIPNVFILNKKFIVLYKENVDIYLKKNNLLYLKNIIISSIHKHLIMMELNEHYKNQLVNSKIKSYSSIEKSFKKNFYDTYKLYSEQKDECTIDAKNTEFIKTIKQIFNQLNDFIKQEADDISQKVNNEKIINYLKKYNPQQKENLLLKNFIIETCDEIGEKILKKILYDYYS